MVRESKGDVFASEFTEEVEKEGSTCSWGIISGGHGCESCRRSRSQMPYPTPLKEDQALSFFGIGWATFRIALTRWRL